jgi:hypothetical protein
MQIVVVLREGNKMMKIKLYSLLALILIFPSCANGPCRYKSLGYYRYGTYEFTKRAHPALMPIAAVGGIATDSLLICLDTGANIIVAVPLTFTHGGPDADGILKDHSLKNIVSSVIVFPFWYPFTIAALGIWPEPMYEEVFGKGSQLFCDTNPPDIR